MSYGYVLWLDLETFNDTPISNGTYTYAESAEIILAPFAIDDHPAEIIDCTAETDWRDKIDTLLAGAGEVWAQNSMFDRNVLAYNGFPTKLKNWRDTMIQAYSHGLPGSLGKLSKILGLPEDKAKAEYGRELVLFFCKPRPKNHKLRRATRFTHPEKWEAFKEYARLDIEAMRECHKRMPTINYPDGPELEYWHLDQERNDRGFLVDVALADGAIELAKREKERLDTETRNLTNGQVSAATQRDALLQHIMKVLGFPLPDLTKDTLERRLNDDQVPSDVKELLRIRLQSATTSVSKYKSLRKAVNSDNVFRGGIQFAGAMRTGRDAGRTFQPQNLPSRGLLGKRETKMAINFIRAGITPPPEQFPDLMHALSSSVRGLLIPRQGNKLIVADYSNIEGRFAAWVCREEWKLDAFRAYDNGTGEDLYKLAYARSFNCDPSEVRDGSLERDIGKVQELMLQYQGGVGAFLTGSETYGFDIEDLTQRIWETLPVDLVTQAADFLSWTISQKRTTFGLSREAFITCDVLKRMWRAANPNIVAMWGMLEDAGLSAIDSPGKVFRVGKYLKFLRNGKHLYLKLPSGRWLTYPGCQIRDDKITFMGANPYTRKFERLNTYGGKLFENVCQGGSRDILKNGEKQAKLQGFKNVLPVHDELVTEAPNNDYFTPHMLSVAMCTRAEWMGDFPLTAKAWEGYRYGK